MSDMKAAREAAALVYSRRLYHGAGGRARGIEVDDIMAPLIPGVLDDTNAVIDAFLSELEKTHAVVPRTLTDTMMLVARAERPSNDWRENIQRAWTAMLSAEGVE